MLCPGPFALCAASTCSKTGHLFPNTKFPELVCQCPVLQGPALAMLNGGNMGDTCVPPKDPGSDKRGIWSLYSTVSTFPQKINGTWQKDVESKIMGCPARSSTQPPKPIVYGQCFSFACRNVREENGVLIADCYCPGEHVIDPKNTSFATQAGQCNQSACNDIPVGGPFPVPQGTCVTP